LYQAFGLTILEGGFFHADPHPGNIFVLDDGRVGLIDFGQVKQIGARASTTLAKVMVALAARGAGGGEGEDEAQLDEISRLRSCPGHVMDVSRTRRSSTRSRASLSSSACGSATARRARGPYPPTVRTHPLPPQYPNPGSPREGPAATAIWLFDGSVDTLPGGFDTNELSPNSPVKARPLYLGYLGCISAVSRLTSLARGSLTPLPSSQRKVLQSFPQELTLVGRSTAPTPKPKLAALLSLTRRRSSPGPHQGHRLPPRRPLVAGLGVGADRAPAPRSPVRGEVAVRRTSPPPEHRAAAGAVGGGQAERRGARTPAAAAKARCCRRAPLLKARVVAHWSARHAELRH